MSSGPQRLDTCPNCNISWIGDEIPDGLFKTGYYANMDEAREVAKRYGWTKKNRKCFRNEIGRYCELEDRVIAYECFNCNKQFPENTFR